MSYRFATQEEIDNWDKLVIANPDNGNIFQTKGFGLIKSTNNWHPKYITINNIYSLVLEKKLPILGNFWYIPKGPGINAPDQLKSLLKPLKDFAKDNKVFAVKLEPELIVSPDTNKKIKSLGLNIRRGIQAANTIVLDIAKPLDEITAKFSPKTRYNIRAANKANVTTEIAPIDNESCKLFYDLMVATINGRSPLRHFEYYKNYWTLHYQAGTGLFLFAKNSDQILSMDFITILGNKATRKDAASIRDHSVRGASALLELEAIKYLKEKGITVYDLYGTPPSDQIKNPDHPYYGFGNFKAGFSPDITDYIGSCDLIVDKFKYNIWIKIGERITHRFYHIINRENFY